MSENYIPLYRKYRPQTLETLVGQEHVKKTLTSAIELGKISHAYLFTGPRGTGKTSTARILAKSLNCVNGPTVKPCGECASCMDITNSVPIDVIEIDAASNRSVDDARNILEKIQYATICAICLAFCRVFLSNLCCWVYDKDMNGKYSSKLSYFSLA